jgi:hypothetical protein
VEDEDFVESERVIGFSEEESGSYSGMEDEDDRIFTPLPV